MGYKQMKLTAILILLLASGIFAQSSNYYYYYQPVISNQYTAVITLDTSTYPVTPFNNGWVVFNGVGNKQFMRSRDLNFTEFIYSVTDSFTIQTRIQIQTRKAMWITGKHNGSGGSWILAFNSNSGNTLEFYLNGWKSIKLLASNDTLWQTVLIKFRKSDNELKIWCNDTLVSTTTSFTYTSSNNTNAFSVGHAQMPGNYADPTTGAGSPTTHFFSGKMDYLYIHKYYNGGDSAAVYNFNEGVGQMGYDSVTYTQVDATTPDGFREGSHLCSGWNTGRDSQDVTWSKGIRKNTTYAEALGSGVWKWGYAGSPWYLNSFTNGQELWGSYLVVTAEFNTVNVTDGVFSYTGDTAKGIAKWNGSTWSKIGNNGSTFVGGDVTQAYAYGDTLFAGGSFTNANGLANADYVAMYKGTSWDSCGKGLDNSVLCFNTYNGKLVCGGYFNNSGSTSITSSVAQWNYTSWSAVGTNDISVVWSLEVYNGSLYAGTQSGLHKFNGSTWDSIPGTGGKTIYALQVHNNELWVTGIEILGKYNGTAYTSMGTMSGFAVHGIEMTSLGNNLYLTGSFFRIIYNNTNTVCNKLARWNGREWSAVNYGLDMRPEDIEIRNDTIYISGDFYSIDGVSAQNVGIIINQ
jgi:hypothetical protein